MIAGISAVPLTVHEALGVLYYNASLSYPVYRALCEWFGCYVYIMPSERTLNASVFSVSSLKKRPTYTLHLYHFQLALEYHYTSTQQSNIIRHILCYQPTQ